MFKALRRSILRDSIVQGRVHSLRVTTIAAISPRSCLLLLENIRSGQEVNIEGRRSMRWVMEPEAMVEPEGTLALVVIGVSRRPTVKILEQHIPIVSSITGQLLRWTTTLRRLPIFSRWSRIPPPWSTEFLIVLPVSIISTFTRKTLIR